MKIQDILFFAILAFVFYRRDSKLAAAFGIGSLVLAIPLFSFWIFFTAERLTWYAAAFFLLSVIFYLFEFKKAR